MSDKPVLVIFDSHPVQYRAPLYRELQNLVPDTFLVVYATDFSARYHHDPGFQRSLCWDEPLLDGYQWQCLHSDQGVPLSGRMSLTGKGVLPLVRHLRPKAVLSTQFIYAYDIIVWLSAFLFGAQLWMRQETQDELFKRSKLKSLFRDLCYRLAYSRVTKAFSFGHLNEKHLLRYGIRQDQIVRTFFATVDRIESLSTEERRVRRIATRSKISASDINTVVTFVGKLIPVKNPGILIDALCVSSNVMNYHLLYVGAGELEESLRSTSKASGLPTHFAGFVNQAGLADYYLATDILVLPSFSEAWGLVVNEALQAGCSVIVTSAVGCNREFRDWERFRVVIPDDPAALAAAIDDLASLPRDFDWCRERMRPYSIKANALALAQEIESLKAS